MSRFIAGAVFSNNMVLQREKNISVFGYGENTKTVIVSLNGERAEATIGNGRWCATLPPMLAGDGYTMSIECDNEVISFTNIAIGEVWLAGGQSNMEFELQNCKGGAEALNNDINPNVRFYYTQKNSFIDENFFDRERRSCWSVFSEENARNWSATGYFFARKLAKELGVTVGIIGCNWGGTSASAWMSRERLFADSDLKTYIDEYEKAVGGKSKEEQIKEYNDFLDYHNAWEVKAEALYTKAPDLSWDEIQEICGENKWPGPMGCSNPYRPHGLYESMLERVIPYTLKGFIYYQGESDDHKPRMYFKLFSNLIQQWRDDWGDDSLPFLFVQLPMHTYSGSPDNKHWCLIREAQMRVFATVKNTGIAIIPDYSEYNEIHPKDKLPVGERLALQALYSVYKKIDESKAFGPMYKSMRILDHGIELSFDYAQDGLVSSGELKGFEIAGDNKVFFNATAQIRGDKIFAFSNEVKKPKHIRYCWSNYVEVSVFGKNAIPLAPFRTSMNDEM